MSTTSDSSTHHKTFPFLHLPRELRDKIYAFALSTHQTHLTLAAPPSSSYIPLSAISTENTYTHPFNHHLNFHIAHPDPPLLLQPPSTLSAQLLRVSTQLHAETHNLLYRARHLHLAAHDLRILAFLLRLAPQHRSLLQQITFPYSTFHQRAHYRASASALLGPNLESFAIWLRALLPRLASVTFELSLDLDALNADFARAPKPGSMDNGGPASMEEDEQRPYALNLPLYATFAVFLSDLAQPASISALEAVKLHYSSYSYPYTRSSDELWRFKILTHGPYDLENREGDPVRDAVYRSVAFPFSWGRVNPGGSDWRWLRGEEEEAEEKEKVVLPEVLPFAVRRVEVDEGKGCLVEITWVGE